VSFPIIVCPKLTTNLINECRQFEEHGEELKISHDINTESVGPKIENNIFQFFQKIDLFQNIY